MISASSHQILSALSKIGAENNSRLRTLCLCKCQCCYDAFLSAPGPIECMYVLAISTRGGGRRGMHCTIDFSPHFRPQIPASSLATLMDISDRFAPRCCDDVRPLPSMIHPRFRPPWTLVAQILGRFARLLRLACTCSDQHILQYLLWMQCVKKA